MNITELKVARVRRGISGREAADAIGLTVDGYFKKEHGDARMTLPEIYVLTRKWGLTLTEFVNIFFDGDLPFLYDDEECCDYDLTVKPLRMARVKAGYTEEEAAQKLSISVGSYKEREKGKVRITLEECGKLSRMYHLTFREFNDIFFKSGLQYRKEDFDSFKHIVA